MFILEGRQSKINDETLACVKYLIKIICLFLTWIVNNLFIACK